MTTIGINDLGQTGEEGGTCFFDLSLAEGGTCFFDLSLAEGGHVPPHGGLERPQGVMRMLVDLLLSSDHN